MRRRAASCSALFLIVGALLSACGSDEADGDYVGGAVSLDCAPFARELSGVRLSGAAADWWWQADGRYTRGDSPSVGSVLVLRRSGRLPSGHVAVVSQVLGARQILVTQANWVHHRVSQDQSVIDVSPRNELVRGPGLVAANPPVGHHRLPSLRLHPRRPGSHTRSAHRSNSTRHPPCGERVEASTLILACSWEPGLRPRPRDGRALSHMPALRGPSSTASRVPTPRRRTGSSASRARRAASSR